MYPAYHSRPWAIDGRVSCDTVTYHSPVEHWRSGYLSIDGPLTENVGSGDGCGRPYVKTIFSVTGKRIIANILWEWWLTAISPGQFFIIVVLFFKTSFFFVNFNDFLSFTFNIGPYAAMGEKISKCFSSQFPTNTISTKSLPGNGETTSCLSLKFLWHWKFNIGINWDILSCEIYGEWLIAEWNRRKFGTGGGMK